MTNEYADIMTQIFAYGEELRNFVDDHALPEEWFNEPDHVAYKCRDEQHFDHVLQEASHDVQSMSYVEIDNRRIAGAEVEQSVYLESFGTINWLEIIQSRPEKLGQDIVGLEHVEFYWPELESAEEVLRDRGIPYELQSNEQSQWLSIIITEFGHELKLTNTRLANIVRDSMADGEATIVV